MTYYNSSSMYDNREFKLTIDGEDASEFAIKICSEFPYQVSDENKKTVYACKTQDDQEFILKALSLYDRILVVLDYIKNHPHDIEDPGLKEWN